MEFVFSQNQIIINRILIDLFLQKMKKIAENQK